MSSNKLESGIGRSYLALERAACDAARCVWAVTLEFVLPVAGGLALAGSAYLACKFAPGVVAAAAMGVGAGLLGAGLLLAAAWAVGRLNG